MRTDYESEIEELNKKVQMLQDVKNANEGNEAGTAQVLIKFQDELALKDKQLSEQQASSKKKLMALETQMKVEQKKSATQIAKLNTKLDKSELLAGKSYDLDTELQSLKQQLSIKENEITRLNQQLRKTGGAIEEEASEDEEDSIIEVTRKTPSPDQDL